MKLEQLPLYHFQQWLTSEQSGPKTTAVAGNVFGAQLLANGRKHAESLANNKKSRSLTGTIRNHLLANCSYQKAGQLLEGMLQRITGLQLDPFAISTGPKQPLTRKRGRDRNKLCLSRTQELHLLQTDMGSRSAAASAHVNSSGPYSAFTIAKRRRHHQHQSW